MMRERGIDDLNCLFIVDDQVKRLRKTNSFAGATR